MKCPSCGQELAADNTGRCWCGGGPADIAWRARTDAASNIARDQSEAQRKAERRARPLKVFISVIEGRHRLHVNGEFLEVSQLASLASRWLTHWRYDFASGPEGRWREIRAGWLRSGDQLALRAVRLLDREARPQHLRELPDCPHRDSREGASSPRRPGP